MKQGSRAIRLPLVAILLCGGLLPAAARDDVFSDAPPRRVYLKRHHALRVYGPPPAIVSGYLPRNNGVPMYNEPPGLRAPYGYYGR